jgi:hypothetical protein
VLARNIVRVEVIRARIVVIEVVVAFVLILGQIVFGRLLRNIARLGRGALAPIVVALIALRPAVFVAALGPLSGSALAGSRLGRLAVGVTDAGDRAFRPLLPLRTVALPFLFFPNLGVNKDVVDVEERGLLEADVDKRGLHAGKNPGYTAFINISHDPFARGALDQKILDLPILHLRDADFG